MSVCCDVIPRKTTKHRNAGITAGTSNAIAKARLDAEYLDNI